MLVMILFVCVFFLLVKRFVEVTNFFDLGDDLLAVLFEVCDGCVVLCLFFGFGIEVDEDCFVCYWLDG